MFLFKAVRGASVWLLSALNAAQDAADKGVEKKIDFAVGGQAVLEGVMMRSPNHLTIAVRKTDHSIKVKKEKYIALTKRHKFLNIFILRGVINLFEMMVIGTKAINYSANESLEEPEDIKKNKENEENGKKEPAKNFWHKFGEMVLFLVSLVVAIFLSLALFKGIPLLIATYFESLSDYIKDNYIVFNLIDGASKMLIFLAYIFILTLIPSFRRLFEYHGAEHKSIFTYEQKLPLTVENAKKQSRFHPRCGTSFILIVFTISIIVYTFIPKQESFTANLLLRIAALPLIAGISYEYLKLSAKYVRNFFVKALVAPGLWFQRLTTKEPDASQLEVGLASLQAALEMEDTKRSGVSI